VLKRAEMADVELLVCSNAVITEEASFAQQITVLVVVQVFAVQARLVPAVMPARLRVVRATVVQVRSAVVPVLVCQLAVQAIVVQIKFVVVLMRKSSRGRLYSSMRFIFFQLCAGVWFNILQFRSGLQQF
jgi:hypothetical protein